MHAMVGVREHCNRRLLRHEVLLALEASVMPHPLLTSMLEGLTFMGTPHPALPLCRG